MRIRDFKSRESGTGEITMDYAESTFKELLAFQGYGFCKAHATSYSVYSAVQMWLQDHYFLEYMCALLSHIDRAKEKKGVAILNERVAYCVRHGMTIHYPDVNESGGKWLIKGGGLLAPLKNIKGFSDRELGIVEAGRPYADLKDFLDRTEFNAKRFEQLLFARAFDRWGTVEDLYNWYRNTYSEEARKEKERLKELKKGPRTEDLFSFLDGPQEPEDVPEEMPETVTRFSPQELEERCMDLNGFVVPDNLLARYHEFFEGGMRRVAEYVRNEDYGRGNGRIYTIGEILRADIGEDKYKNCWMLAKVTVEERGVRGKWGTYDKIYISDGSDLVNIMSNAIPKVFSKGSVLIFPVSVSDRRRIYLDTHVMERLEPVVLE